MRDYLSQYNTALRLAYCLRSSEGCWGVARDLNVRRMFLRVEYCVRPYLWIVSSLTNAERSGIPLNFFTATSCFPERVAIM